MEFKKANRLIKRVRQTPPLDNRASSAPPHPPTVTPSPTHHEESHTPHAKKPVQKLKKLRTKKGMLIGSIVLILVVIWVWSLINQGDEANRSDGTNPNYQTVIPKGKSIDDLGGWKRVSPPKAEPVYAYSDSLDNVTISVSQQPLPTTFEGQIDDQVAELAKRFNATDEVDADGTKIFVGTSAKGPQSAIFSKNGLLVLIKSQKKIDDKAWAYYVESLIGTDPTLSNF